MIQFTKLYSIMCICYLVVTFICYLVELDMVFRVKWVFIRLICIWTSEWFVRVPFDELNLFIWLNCICSPLLFVFPSSVCVQDQKKGKLRYVANSFPHHGYIWNYGALPQVGVGWFWYDMFDEVDMNILHGDFFNWSPPKFPKYKSLYNLWLREILSQFRWDLVLRKYGGAPVKKSHPVL